MPLEASSFVCKRKSKNILSVYFFQGRFYLECSGNLPSNSNRTSLDKERSFTVKKNLIGERDLMLQTEKHTVLNKDFLLVFIKSIICSKKTLLRILEHKK